MKTIKRWGIAGALGALLLMPGTVQAQFLSGTYYGGSNFQTGFDVDLSYMGTDAGGNHVLQLVITNVGAENTGDFAGVFRSIGLANVPAGVNVIGGTADPDQWTFNAGSSLTGDGLEEVVWAWYADAPGTENGLDLGETATFTFLLDDWDPAWENEIGVAVHSFSYGECSTKFGIWNDGADSNDVGPDGYDPNCTPTQVPEPGTNALLAIGLLGMGFVAIRRRSLAELLG